MGRLITRLADLVFTQDKTNWLTDVGDADSLTFYPPASFGGTITIEVAPVEDPKEADFVTLQSGGSDINLTATNGLLLTDLSFVTLRLKSTASETNKVVRVVKQRSA